MMVTVDSFSSDGLHVLVDESHVREVLAALSPAVPGLGRQGSPRQPGLTLIPSLGENGRPSATPSKFSVFGPGRALLYGDRAHLGVRFRLVVDEPPKTEWLEDEDGLKAEITDRRDSLLLSVPSGRLLLWDDANAIATADPGEPRAVASLPPGDYMVDAFSIGWSEDDIYRRLDANFGSSVRLAASRGEGADVALFFAAVVLVAAWGLRAARVIDTLGATVMSVIFIVPLVAGALFFVWQRRQPAAVKARALLAQTFERHESFAVIALTRSHPPQQ